MRLIDNCAKCDDTKDLYIIHYADGLFYLCQGCLREYNKEFKKFKREFLKGKDESVVQ